MPQYFVTAASPCTLPDGRPVHLGQKITLSEEDAAPLVERQRVTPLPTKTGPPAQTAPPAPRRRRDRAAGAGAGDVTDAPESPDPPLADPPDPTTEEPA